MPNQDNWGLYYEKTSLNPPRETLSKALDSFKQEGKVGKAFELGSGAGNDVACLLKEGWQLTAVDNEAKAEVLFNKKFGSNPKATFQLTSFENIKWQEVLFVHAGFALAFCPQKHLNNVIQAIKQHLSLGGRFAGNFFGPEHTWNDLALVSKEEVLNFFAEFEIEWIEETKNVRLSTLGEEIFHHNISLIAKKIV